MRFFIFSCHKQALSRVYITETPKRTTPRMDSNEFKQEVIPHYRAMYGVAVAMLGGDSQRAEDAVQDTMLRLWDHRGQLAAVSSLKAYAIRAVRNRCLELIRSAAPEADVDDPVTRTAVDAASVTPQQAASEASDQLELASRLIGSLPESQQEILRMRAFADLDNEEIAQALGINNATVRQQLSRARETLRQLMGSHLRRP